MPSLRERFLTKVYQHDSGCWLWTATLAGAGYGQIRLAGRGSPMVYAHRVAYELFLGEIPPGHEIDHRCRVKACVNPDHLEAVTHGENIRRTWPFREPQNPARRAAAWRTA